MLQRSSTESPKRKSQKPSLVPKPAATPSSNESTKAAKLSFASQGRTFMKSPLFPGGGQSVLPEALAQRRLLDLAGGGMGDFLHEHHVVRHPPFGDLAGQILQDFRRRGALAGLQH